MFSSMFAARVNATCTHYKHMWQRNAHARLHGVHEPCAPLPVNQKGCMGAHLSALGLELKQGMVGDMEGGGV